VVALLALGLGLGLVGCGGTTASVSDRAVKARAPATPHRQPLAAAPAIGAFGLELMRTLGSGNLVFSPDSIATALAMAGTGAAGQTADQMADVLQLASPTAFAGVGQLQGTIAREQATAGRGQEQAPTLDLANGLFLQRGYALQAGFLSSLAGHFGAAPQTVDFEHDSAGAVQAIDSWVSAHTQGTIPHILASISPQTRLALANAIYLKAVWLKPFQRRATATAPFHGERGVTAVPFMHETDELSYGHGSGYAAVDLPYRASTFSLLIVLPTGQSVAALQRRLDPSLLAGIVHSLAPTPVSLSLPRFHLALQLDLNDSLQALGMTDPFSAAADFSRIAPGERLRIGAVEHAADFTVDEEGTVATAATVVTIEATAVHAPLPRPTPFTANRPFLFFLCDDRTGTVLFAGRLTDPAAAPAPG
jgi:serpin B